MRYRIKEKNGEFTVQQKRFLFWTDSIADWNYYYDAPAVYPHIDGAMAFIKKRKRLNAKVDAPTLYHYPE